jgi:hypothetical protein
MLQDQLNESAIRDTIAAVFRTGAFNRPLRQTLWDRVISWFLELLSSLFQAAHDHPIIYWTAVSLLVLAVASILARSFYLAYKRAQLLANARGAAGFGPGAGNMQDAWQLAQRYAAEGKFTEAAHAIYWHLLQWLAHRERIVLHPSKTVGDYARELRARSSQLFANYRDFARTYEVVVYGLGTCDRERYDRLLALATAITQKNG